MYEAWTMEPSSAAGKPEWTEEDVQASAEVMNSLTSISSQMQLFTSCEATIEGMVRHTHTHFTECADYRYMERDLSLSL